MRKVAGLDILTYKILCDTMYVVETRKEEMAMEKSEWLSQLRRGILEYSILLLISKKSMYGYDLLASLSQWEALSTTEGTVYPLLRRLEKEKLIVSTWRESNPGIPPRKYYDLTDEGIRFLEIMNEEWGNLATAISIIKNGEGTNGDK